MMGALRLGLWSAEGIANVVLPKGVNEFHWVKELA